MTLSRYALAICFLSIFATPSLGQDTRPTKNEIYTKLNPIVLGILGNPASPDFALGYKRNLPNFNIRAYSWYQFDRFNYSNNFFELTIEQEAGLRIGIERLTRWSGKIKMYYGMDAGASKTTIISPDRQDKIDEFYYIKESRQKHYTSAIVSPFIGLRYDFSPRFYTSLELAPSFSFYRPTEEITVTKEVDYSNPSPAYQVEPEVLFFNRYSLGNIFELKTQPFIFWFGFKF